MHLSLFRRLLLVALLLVIVWTIFGPSGIGEELLSLSLASLLPARALLGPPLALPHLLIPNEEACGGPRTPPFLLILVCTAPDNLNQRNAIRASWGGLRKVRGLRVQTLFLLGEPSRVPTQRSHENDLAQESATQGDILQAAFLDSYRNLTLKTLSGLNWADKHCPMARYILKTDDDVFVNVPELVSELVRRGGRWEQWERRLEPQRAAEVRDEEWEGSPTSGSQQVPLLYLGRVHWWVYPSRMPGGKHQISEEQWPPTWGPFPPYASGTGYVLSASAVQLILKVASRAPPLPLEDVFVGVSARRGGLTPTHCVRLAGATHYPLDRCCYGKFLLTSHRLDPWKMQEAWKLVGGSDGERTAPFCSWLQGVLGILRCRIIAWLHS
ncbi:hypothetical protein MC885_010553 [Smutsia gigantea]|nr:hypothetical protein MC885_010553 [Smutsia gigantea]